MYSDGKEHLKDLKDRYIESLKVYNDKLDIYVSRDLKMKNYDGENFSFLYTYQDISKKYGVSKSKVQRIAKKFNLTRNTNNHDTKPTDLCIPYNHY